MDSFPFNFTDLGIVTIILLSGVFAFYRGFVREIFAMVSWIGAAAVTIYGFAYAQPWGRELITVRLVADSVTGATIFFVALIVLSLLSRFLTLRIRYSGMSPLDRSVGLVFGIFRGAVLVCVAWLLLVWALPREDHPDWIITARSLPLIQRGGAILISLIPERMRGEAGDMLEGIGVESDARGDRERIYWDLVKPVAKGDAPEPKLGYNTRMRHEMQRAIEAATQSLGGDQERAQ